MATGDQDEAAFWATMIEQLTTQSGTSNQQYDVMMAAQAIPCSFAEDLATADAQLHALGDCVPKWSLTWDGSYTGGFFGTYENWLSQLHPSPANDPDADADSTAMATIKQKIVSYSSGIDAIMKAQYKEYIQDNCLSPSSDGTSCDTWLPGQSVSKFSAHWSKYKTSSAYRAQVADLNQQMGADLSGLQSQYNLLAQKLYGPNYKQIADAYQAVQLADPQNQSNPLTPKQLLQYQMQVRQGGTAKHPVDIWVPRYQTPGYTYDQFRTWLKQAAAGKGTALTLEMQTSDHSKDTSSWQFSGGGGFPLEDIFMIGGATSGSHQQVDIKKYDFHMQVTYGSVVYVPIAPATSWFSNSLLSDYRSFSDWQTGSVFQSNNLWGPTGLFNLRTTGVYVARGIDIAFTAANWENFTSETQWHEDASFSLFGLINLGSESSGGQSSTTQVTSQSNGFKLSDTSGLPKIIALTVDATNYPPGS